MSGLTPCAVIVDTRNVHGTGKTIFGSGRRPTASGIRTVMASYGLDPVEIYAGVATASSKKQPSQNLEKMLASNEAYAKRLESDGVTVLHGLLAEQGGKVNEKQVDVRLALQVADLVDHIKDAGDKQVVVFSEDMDLMPAYEYAAKRGVNVYAAAANTVHVRPSQTNWMLLTENAISTLIGEPHKVDTDVIRDFAAEVALGTHPHQPVTWKSLGPQNAGKVRLHSNRSIDAAYLSSSPLQHNERFSLVPDAVEMRGRFPELVLAENSLRATVQAGFEVAVVEAWIDPTQMRVRFTDGKTRNVTVSPGAALIGDEVVVHRDPQDRKAVKYVGLKARWMAPQGWAGSRTGIVTVTDGRKANRRLQAETDQGAPVLLRAAWLQHAGLGSRVLAAVTGLDLKTRLPEVMPLTCCLPQPRHG